MTVADFAIGFAFYFFIGGVLWAMTSEDIEDSSQVSGKISNESFAILLAVFWPIVIPALIVWGLLWVIWQAIKGVVRAFGEVWAALVYSVEARVR